MSSLFKMDNELIFSLKFTNIQSYLQDRILSNLAFWCIITIAITKGVRLCQKSKLMLREKLKKTILTPHQ